MSSTQSNVAADESLQDLLVKTSRTFALAIPELPQPTRREVTIAYLLFRIADTLEDAGVLWSRARRLAALDRFEGLLAAPSPASAAALATDWLADPPCDHAGYKELLARSEFVIGRFLELHPRATRSIAEHTIRTVRLMAEFVGQSDDRGVLQLKDLEALRRYCYAVAGIVGEMLTELFLLGSPALASVADFLRRRAAVFGEGLQLVNILKDSSQDAGEGRNYLPPTLDRGEVFSLARADLKAASEYALAIQRGGGPDGVIAFTALPVELAWATLDKVERDGPGAKIGRARVFRLYERVHRRIAAGRPVTGRPDHASSRR